MSLEVFTAGYAVLDDEKLDEEERVAAVEALVGAAFPQLEEDDAERLVLDVLMAHHQGRPAEDAARRQKLMTGSSSSAVGAGRGGTVGTESAGTDNVGGAGGSSGGSSGGSADTSGETFSGVGDLDNAVAVFGRSSSVVALPADAMTKSTPFDELRRVLGESNSNREIERVLAQNDFDFESTLDLLAGEPLDLHLTKEQTAGRIMCRFYMAGHCARGTQCMYSHDGSGRICRFWLHERCVNGDQCMFLHGVPQLPEKYEKRRAQRQMREVPLPRLGEKMGELKLGELPKLGEKPKLGDKPKLGELPKLGEAGKFGNLPKLGQKGGPPATSSPAPQRFAGQPSQLVPGLAPISSVLPPERTLSVALSRPQHAPWHDAAFLDNQTYLDLRAAAAASAEQRNRLLQQSTREWTLNRSASAKELSLKGREAEQTMIRSFRDAAELLWAQRLRPGSEIWLDLHGLHLADAVELLQTRLAEVAAARHDPRAVYVVTGRGHFYAKKYSDQLTQYVKALLDAEGYKYRDLGVEGAYGRTMVVDPWSRLREATTSYDS